MSEMKFSKEHEWVRLDEDGAVTIGISDYAQETIGELVFVELPNIGDTIEQGREVGALESVKAANDLYAPISGEVIEANQNSVDSPNLINQDAEGEGWLFKVKPADGSQLDALMDEAAYKDFLSTLE